MRRLGLLLNTIVPHARPHSSILRNLPWLQNGQPFRQKTLEIPNNVETIESFKATTLHDLFKEEMVIYSSTFV